MKQSSVTLRVENFRAIGKAEIKLDGITVVAGVNGCGKSTLSKLLYWIYRGALDFETLAKADFFERISYFTRLIEMSIFGIAQLNKNAQNLLLTDWQEIKKNIDNQSIKESDFLEFIDKLSQYFNEDDMPNEFKHFIQQALLSINKLDIPESYKNNASIIELMKNVIRFEYEEYVLNFISKSSYLVDNQILKSFNVKQLPNQLDIIENGLFVYSKDFDNINLPPEIDDVIYIDTPMSFNHHEEEHWQDLNEKLKKRPKFNQSAPKTTEIDDLMKREILTGQAEIKFDELSESFTFRTPLGAEIDLSDSATGIKAFAVLNLLLKNGSINSKTLLILDEPEAHLHPQWVVEFGRLLTLINKHIGAKIFVATHSPDMVQALRYIPNKEGIGEGVNFYLAEYNSETHLFDYQDLNGKIGEIFKSFNVSMDKLEQYGEE